MSEDGSLALLTCMRDLPWVAQIEIVGRSDVDRGTWMLSLVDAKTSRPRSWSGSNLDEVIARAWHDISGKVK